MNENTRPSLLRVLAAQCDLGRTRNKLLIQLEGCAAQEMSANHSCTTVIHLLRLGWVLIQRPPLMKAAQNKAQGREMECGVHPPTCKERNEFARAQPESPNHLQPQSKPSHWLEQNFPLIREPIGANAVRESSWTLDSALMAGLPRMMN